MQFIRQQIIPFITIAIALFALVAVTARSFIATDLAEPAPIETITGSSESSPSALTLPSVVNGVRSSELR
ncbi:hypothetical protein VKI21_15610 [Cyanobacterium aponinum UTEX 3222]|uniref:Uncharacterized protein n=2 Tax=Cyanobacterium aponinum TaxID=379064 RepID=K9Z4H9_CYAAP|nr:hypothetical protein [Cyanobacterium aponinum]AFZ53642.1 hypothetical protein Cyan10605_1533 [Cyanobacterium aponinum PCC 10605]MTF39006.1 hypothetical protein [Cyanobacterium aponinum 0216]WRL38063.1 hypothetical protein VKI22_15790 [Cyanobacterium aponinum UTEX 3221]WRL41458.1 hypothetical protein VKI21_15610 [Cyanobacterium aponinum UTEX 3222]